jgi:hypothetical protein
MKILSWNCKGLSRPVVVQTLRRLIRDQSLDVMFLSETKISHPSLYCFEQAWFLPHDLGGGLVLTWRPGVDLEYFISNTNNISAWTLRPVILTLPILHGFSLVSMVLLKEVTKWFFGIPLQPLGMALKPFDFALVTLTQLCISLIKLVASLFLVPLIALLEGL